MPTTVYFATDRTLDGRAEDWTSYGTAIRTPSDPAAVTYAVAFVDNADLTADATGAIQQIQDLRQGGFSQSVVDDLSAPAAFNRKRFAQANLPGADTTVIAFSWPSLGRLLDLPLPWGDYLRDQTMAGQSALHLMTFFANLEPSVRRARAAGSRAFLIAHSVGNWGLAGGR